MAVVAALPGSMASLSTLHYAGLGYSNSSRRPRHRTSILRAHTTLCVANARTTNRETIERSENLQSGIVNRREVMGLCGLAATFSLLLPSEERSAADAAALPEEEKPKLCDPNCEKELENIPTETTASGLQYKDITVGKGPSPPKGFQVAANYVAMIPSGKVFDSSLEKGLPYIFRVGSGQVIMGLDEGISSMKVGGKRRLYIPGELAFPKGLSSAAGRPRVPPASPVVFDVDLLYIPGLENDLGIEEEPPSESSSEIDTEEETTAEAIL